MTTAIQLGHWPNLPPRAHQLMRVIRDLVKAGAPVTLLDHAEKRLLKRDLDMNDVLQSLKVGDIEGPVIPGEGEDEWHCKVTAPVRYPVSNRMVGVVTIVIRARELLIKTVEWEDGT